MKYELLEFSLSDIDKIADCFGGAMDCHCYTCYACAIMPDHVHVLIRKHKHMAEEMIANLQDSSRKRQM